MTEFISKNIDIFVLCAGVGSCLLLWALMIRLQQRDERAADEWLRDLRGWKFKQRLDALDTTGVWTRWG